MPVVENQEQSKGVTHSRGCELYPTKYAQWPLLFWLCMCELQQTNMRKQRGSHKVRLVLPEQGIEKDVLGNKSIVHVIQVK